MSAKIHTSLVGTFLLLQAITISADESGSYPYYGGFNLGFSQADQDCGYDYYDYDCDGEDTSFSFYGGKRFHKNLAFEVAYLDLGKLDNEKGYSTTTAETTGINFSFLGIIPFESSGYLYGKAGFMSWKTDYSSDESGTTTTSDDDGTDFTFGIGYAFIIQDSYEFRVEFERLNELNDDFNDGGSYITNLTFGGNVYFQ
jgi:OOP family OmpA-OmpF porin